MYSHYLEPCSILLIFSIYKQDFYGYQAPYISGVDHNIVTLILAVFLKLISRDKIFVMFCNACGNLT